MTTYTIEEIDQIMQEMKAELAELKNNSRRRQVNWPPPEGWEEVVITWDSVFSTDKLHIPEIIEWLDKTPGGKYHLHGWKGQDGFAFRFEDAHDATYFRLIWG